MNKKISDLITVMKERKNFYTKKQQKTSSPETKLILENLIIEVEFVLKELQK